MVSVLYDLTLQLEQYTTQESYSCTLSLLKSAAPDICGHIGLCLVWISMQDTEYFIHLHPNKEVVNRYGHEGWV